MQEISAWYKHQFADGRWVLVTTGATYQAVRVFNGATPRRGDYDALLTHYIANRKKYLCHTNDVTRYSDFRSFLLLGVKPRLKP